MIRYLFLFLLLFHGLIHLMGFVKAFNLAAVDQLTQNITKTNGVLWLVAMVLLVATVVLLSLGQDSWWLYAFKVINVVYNPGSTKE